MNLLLIFESDTYIKFFPKQKKLNDSVQLLEDFKNGKLDSNITNEELWQAQKIKQVI